MANITNLSTFLSDVANAIREKKGTDEQIPAANFDTEIKSIPTGGGSGDVKLFKTIDEMNADNSAKDGDLAVVYREEIQNMTSEAQTQYITFPETVTLPEAFTDSVYTMLRAVDSSVMFDGNIMLDNSSFRFDGWSESGMIRVSYSSTDGITYTRQEFTGDSGDLTNPVDLGTIVHCEMPEEWNDTLGYFMQIVGSTFDGLFEYGNDTKLLKYVSSKGRILYMPNVNTLGGNYEPLSRNAVLLEVLSADADGRILTGKWYGTGTDVNIEKHFYLNENNVIMSRYNSNNYSEVFSYGGYEFKVDWENNEVANTSEVLSRTVTYDENLEFVSNVPVYTTELADVLLFNGSIDNVKRYVFAENQYTLKYPNQLLPEIVAYGKNGAITGDGSIYNNLSYSSVLSVVGIDAKDLEKIDYSSSQNIDGIHVYTESDANTFTNIQHNILREITSSKITEAYYNIAGYNISAGECIELNNGNKMGCFLHKVNNTGSSRRCTLVIFNKDFDVLSSTELATNTNTMAALDYVFTDEYIYVVSGGYYSSNNYWYVSKISRYDGSVIKSASATNKKLNHNSNHVTWYNNGVLIYGEDSNYCESCGIIHFTSDLDVDINTSVDVTGDRAGSSGVGIGVIVNNNFYCIVCGYVDSSSTYRKLIKISGTSVTSKDVTSNVSSNNLSCDDTYIYAQNSNNYCTKFDTSMNVVSTTETYAAMYHNVDYITMSFTDYLNYSVLDVNTNVLYVVSNGVSKQYYASISTTKGNGCYNTSIDELIWRNASSYLGKHILTNGITYTEDKRFPCNGNIILVTTMLNDGLYSMYKAINNNRNYNDTISPDEYNIALDTAKQIEGGVE